MYKSLESRFPFPSRTKKKKKKNRDIGVPWPNLFHPRVSDRALSIHARENAFPRSLDNICPSSSSCNPRLTDYFPFRSLKHFCFAFISDSLSHSIMYSSQPDRVPRLQWPRTNGKTDPRVWIGRCARARMGLAKDPRADNLFEENEREIREIHFERMVSLFFFF